MYDGLDKREKRQYELVDHLMTVGWVVNHNYLDNKVIDQYDGDLKRAMWGKHGLNFYLISYCGKYTCTVDTHYTQFWRMVPKWYKLCKFSNSKVKFTEKGIIEIGKKADIYSKTIEISLPLKEDGTYGIY